MKDAITTIRSACLRSFPEFIADIRAAALGKGGEFSTGLADFTHSVCFLTVRVRIGSAHEDCFSGLEFSEGSETVECRLSRDTCDADEGVPWEIVRVLDDRAEAVGRNDVVSTPVCKLRNVDRW